MGGEEGVGRGTRRAGGILLHASLLLLSLRPPLLFLPGRRSCGEKSRCCATLVSSTDCSANTAAVLPQSVHLRRRQHYSTTVYTTLSRRQRQRQVVGRVLELLRMWVRHVGRRRGRGQLVLGVVLLMPLQLLLLLLLMETELER